MKVENVIDSRQFTFREEDSKINSGLKDRNFALHIFIKYVSCAWKNGFLDFLRAFCKRSFQDVYQNSVELRALEFLTPS